MFMLNVDFLFQGTGFESTCFATGRTNQWNPLQPFSVGLSFFPYHAAMLAVGFRVCQERAHVLVPEQRIFEREAQHHLEERKK